MTRVAAEAQRLEQELKQEASKSLDLGSMTPTSIDEVKARLRPGEVLLEYVAYEGLRLADWSKSSNRYGVFVLSGGAQHIAALDLGEQEAIDKLIVQYRDLESAQADPITGKLDEAVLARLGQAVRARILDPALKGVTDVKRVYIAPDGLIGMVPFEALPTTQQSAPRRYLVEDAEIVYLVSGRDLVQRQARPRNASKDIWIVGDPAYDATPEQRLSGRPVSSISTFTANAQEREKGVVLVAGAAHPKTDESNRTLIPTDWARLEGTRTIVNAAAQATRTAGLSPHILLDAAASEDNVYEIRRPRALIFATHGYFMAKAPIGYLSLNIEMGHEGVGVNADFVEREDPLHRSMLIMAGANRRAGTLVRYAIGTRLVSELEAKRLGLDGDALALARRELGDGLLTGYEAMGMDLVGTELVVLTACESGIGVTQAGPGAGALRQAEGESIAGLRQGLMIAGTQAVVMSLWSVPLDETAAQMQSFLNLWLAGAQSRYQAFRAAQLAALERARRGTGGGHPFWWAGFIYAGDPGDR